MQRLARYGANQLEKITEQSFIGKLLKEFTHFFALILWLAAALAFVAEWKNPGQGMATLGYAVLGVILINGLFSFWQEYRAEKALVALRNLLPHHTTALRDGHAVQVPVAELVPGDVVLLAAGDDVPADCRLIEAFGVRVNTANLTGESKPMAREADHVSEEQAALRRDILHAGTSLISGEAKAIVYATGMHTEFGNIARLTQTAHEPLSPLQKEIARLSRLVALFATLARRGVLPDRPADRPVVLGKPGVRDRHHRRQRAGRIAAHRHAVAGDGDAAHGEEERAGAPSARRGNAGCGQRDLQRQDRHADAKPHEHPAGVLFR